MPEHRVPRQTRSPSPQDDLPADPSALLTQVSHRSMATDFVVMLAANCADRVEAAFQALEKLDQVEAALTVYRETSEISSLNARGNVEPVELSPPTFDLIRRAVHWSLATDGAFDITAAPLVDVWGFTARAGKKPTSVEVETALAKCGYLGLRLNPADCTVGFAKPGMKVNLGAIGKGDAIDRLAAELRQNGIEDFLIHGGQSSVLAGGDQTPGSGHGWAVGVAHPTKPRKRIAGIWLRNAAIGTSGSGKQFFHHRGRRFGHVIDPRTGYPASDLMSVTAVMPSAADADAVATGLFVAGSAEARKFHGRTPATCPCGNPVAGLPVLLARPGRRQDEAVLEALGSFEWVRGGRPPEQA